MAKCWARGSGIAKAVAAATALQRRFAEFYGEYSNDCISFIAVEFSLGRPPARRVGGGDNAMDPVGSEEAVSGTAPQGPTVGSRRF